MHSLLKVGREQIRKAAEFQKPKLCATLLPTTHQRNSFDQDIGEQFEKCLHSQ